MRTTLATHYLEYVDRSVNADKFYLCLVFEENGRFLAHTQWGRRGADGQSKVLYVGPSRTTALNEINKKYDAKRAEGYQDIPVASRVTVAAIIHRLEKAPMPGAAPAPATPATPPAPVRNLVPCPGPMGIVPGDSRPGDFVIWMPPGTRAICLIPAVGTASLLVPEKGPTGRWMGDPKSFSLELLRVLGKLDVRKPAAPDTVLDVVLDPVTKTLVILDVLRFRGTEVAAYPLAHRLQILDELEVELREDGQLHPAWKIAGPDPVPGRPRLARGLGEPYAPGKAPDWRQLA